MDSSRGKSPSATAKKTKRARKASGRKGAKKHSKGPTSGDDNIDVDPLSEAVL